MQSRRHLRGVRPVRVVRVAHRQGIVRLLRERTIARCKCRIVTGCKQILQLGDVSLRSELLTKNLVILMAFTADQDLFAVPYMTFP